VGQIRTAAAGTSLDDTGTKTRRKIKTTVLTLILGFRLFHHLEEIIDEECIRARHIPFTPIGQTATSQTHTTELEASRRYVSH
jgi:hypothetical protein